MSNDFDDPGLDKPCRHGKLIRECREERCQKIAEVLQIKPGTPTKVEPWYTGAEPESRSDKRAHEKWQEESASQRHEPNATATTQQVFEGEPQSENRICHSLVEVFPADTRPSKRGLRSKSIRYAERLHFITEREARILGKLQQSPGKVNYSEMARSLGWSPDTVGRDYKNLVRRFLQKCEGASLRGGDIIERRIRGGRRKRYWRVREIRLGEFQSILVERVEVGKKVANRKKGTHNVVTRGDIATRRSEGRLHQQRMIAYCGPSPMNVIFAAVCAELASPRDEQLLQRYDHLRRLPEWSPNLARARKLVQGKRGLWDEPSYAEVGQRMKRKLPRCDWCQTPVLVGFRLNGKRIKRLNGRQFCSDACKMKRHRREKHLTPSKDIGEPDRSNTDMSRKLSPKILGHSSLQAIDDVTARLRSIPLQSRVAASARLANRDESQRGKTFAFHGRTRRDSRRS